MTRLISEKITHAHTEENLHQLKQYNVSKTYEQKYNSEYNKKVPTNLDLKFSKDKLMQKYEL